MTSRSAPEIVELDTEQTDALLCRLESCQLTPEDITTLRAALESYLYVTQLIDQKSTTIARLRKLLFGAETEKTAAVTGRHAESPLVDGAGQAGFDCRALRLICPWNLWGGGGM